MIQKTILAALITIAASAAHAASYSQFVLYKSGAQSLPTSSVADWRPPSNAYTAITILMPFDQIKADGYVASKVSSQIVWAANSSGGNTGVMIQACPAQTGAQNGAVECSTLAFFAANNSGPADYTPGCVSNPGGAFPCRSDMTADFNNLIAAGIPRYITIASYGNGYNGPLIWDVEFFVSWKKP